MLAHGRGIIKNCINLCNVSGTTSNNEQVGGIIGRLLGNRIYRCINKGEIYGEVDKVGGIAGYVRGNGRIEECINYGDVSGSTSIGGIVGLNGYGSHSVSGHVVNCYNTGEIYGEVDKAGGIVGNNQYQSTVSNSYNIGVISGNSVLGGIVGNYINTTTVSNCYYLTGTATYGLGSTSNNTGAEQKTVTQLQTQGTFVGWEFPTIWKIVPGRNNGYPILAWE